MLSANQDPVRLPRCSNLTAKPRMSRSASAAPRSPATVVKRAKSSVCLPIWLKSGTGVVGDVVVMVKVP